MCYNHVTTDPTSRNIINSDLGPCVDLASRPDKIVVIPNTYRRQLLILQQEKTGHSAYDCFIVTVMLVIVIEGIILKRHRVYVYY